MRKDSEKFLEILLNKRKETGMDILECDIEEFTEIPNIKFNMKDILDDLKIHGCISNASALYLGGELAIYLTMEGIDYFKGKESYRQGGLMHNHINNFYGSVRNMQIQQGTQNSNQTQNVAMTEAIDFAKVGEFVANIKKYDTFFESEFGDHVTEVKEMLQEIEDLVQKKENPSKIKMLLIELKNLSVGITGSLIATGIVEGIKRLFV